MSQQIVFKPANVDETFALDWRKFIVESWRPDAQYASGSIIRPPVGNGYYYEATTSGLSSRLQPPDFPPVVGETFIDGSVVWTAHHPSTPTLDSITVSVWTLDPGISEVSKAIDGFITRITVGGGVEGEQYRATDLITKSNGEDEEDSLIIEIIAPKDV